MRRPRAQGVLDRAHIGRVTVMPLSLLTREIRTRGHLAQRSPQYRGDDRFQAVNRRYSRDERTGRIAPMRTLPLTDL